jgi:hypothetical protein
MTDLMHLLSARPQSLRRAEPRTRNRLRELSTRYVDTLAAARELSAEIEQEVVAAQAAGRSLPEISEASGLSVAQIEYVLVSVDFQRRLPKL